MGRALYLAAGLLCVTLGIAGIALPVLPTVPFFLLAAFCFARSRPEWAARLYDHPRYGPAMRRWRDRRAIARKAKIASLATMGASAAVVWLTADWRIALAVSLILIATGSWIWTRAE